MTKPLKIAGQGCDWTEEVAALTKNRLCEVGFYARILNLNSKFYVVYSYRDFTKEEAFAVLSQTFVEKEHE
jgi:hypothetical protein